MDAAQNSFILAEVFLAGWFSIGVGTVIFVGSEAAIRRSVKAVTHTTLLQVEREAAKLTARMDVLTADQFARLNDLNVLHNDVAGTSSYRSFILSGLSLLVPFIIPVLGLLFHKGAG